MVEQTDRGLEEITRICRKTGHLMAESLWEYWPTNNGNEMAEKNISLHFGVALWEAGYRLFAEAHPENETQKHLDLFAFNPDSGNKVFCEFKRTWNDNSFRLVKNDTQRVRDFRPRIELQGNEYGLIACTTWNVNIVEWWNASPESEVNETKDMNIFYRDLVPHNPRWGHVQIQADNNAREKLTGTHHFLYCAFRIR